MLDLLKVSRSFATWNICSVVFPGTLDLPGFVLVAIHLSLLELSINIGIPDLRRMDFFLMVPLSSRVVDERKYETELNSVFNRSLVPTRIEHQYPLSRPGN